MGCACIPVPLASPSRGASPEGRPTAAGRQVGRAGLRAEESERCFSFLIFEEGTVAASRTRTGDSLEGISPPLPCPSPLHSPTSALGLGHLLSPPPGMPSAQPSLLVQAACVFPGALLTPATGPAPARLSHPPPRRHTQGDVHEAL